MELVLWKMHIIVDLKVEKNTLFFYVKNKYSEVTEEVKDKTSEAGNSSGA